MGKEGVPGCRPSVVAVAAAARHITPQAAAPLAGGGLRLAIHPCDFLSWLPASAVPYQLLLLAAALLPFHELFERQFQPSTRSVYSDNRLHNTTT